MDLRDLGLDESMLLAIHDMLELPEEAGKPHPPSRAYVRDNKAMRATPADIIEYPNAYQFVVDMPGLKADQMKVQIEDGNVLVVSGERKREKEKHEKDQGVEYLRMERRLGKFLKKFALFDNANRDAISAVYQDGVLTVTVEKLPPPEPKKPKTIEVRVGSPAGSQGQGEAGSQGQGEAVQT